MAWSCRQEVASNEKLVSLLCTLTVLEAACVKRAQHEPGLSSDYNRSSLIETSRDRKKCSDNLKVTIIE